MAWYKSGTITVTNGSTTVTGSGTQFITNVAIGEALYINDQLYEITNIASDTAFTILPAYLGSTAAGQDYVIVPSQSYIRELAAQAADLVNNYSTIANFAGQGKFGDGTLSAPGIRYSDDLDTGFFRSDTNEVTFVAGGVAQFKYNASGISFVGGSGIDLTTFSIDGTTVTASGAELNYVDGVTSNIQTQLNAKAPTANPTFTGTATIPNANINGGNIDGTPIGGTTASTGTFSSLTASTAEVDKIQDRNGVAHVGQDGFYKADPTSVAFTKTGAGTAEVKAGTLVGFPDGTQVAFTTATTITMPTLAVGTDYAIWVNTDGTIEATTNHTSAPATGSRKVGGFHYAPGGNASLDAAGNWANHTGGNDTPQINEYSFYDLKFKPSAPDPRGLTLVNNSFWVGMYLMSATTTVAPLHKYNVNPARDGNPPQKPYGDGTTYGNARPMNIFECLAYHGFRAPNHNEFQLLALGTTEQTSLGGSGPGNTGVLTSGAGTKERFTSAWGVFDATGVLRVWGRDSLPDNTQDNNVTEGRSNNIWRIGRFANFGGVWDYGAGSGSRYADANTASSSSTTRGGRGVCDHLILV